MNKPMTLPTLVCLTTTLAVGSALMTTGIANAGENHRHVAGHIQQRHGHPAKDAKRYIIRPGFVISGQPTNVKRVLHRHKKPHEARCQTHCYQAMQTAPKGNPTLSTIAGNGADRQPR
jgi:hypothetical protein